MDSKEQLAQESGYIFPYHYLDLKSDEHSFILHLEYLSYMNVVKDLMRPFAGQDILDAGCGDGRFCYEMKKENVRITGIDYSPNAIAFARIINPEVEFDICDLRDFKSSKKFDIICLIETLEHIEPKEIDSILENLAKNLKDGGELIITVPSTNVPLAPKHYQHFTVESLEAAIGKHFKIKKFYGASINNWKSTAFFRIQEASSFLFFLRRRYAFAKNWFLMLKEYYLKTFAIGSLGQANRLIVVCEKADKN